MPRTTSAVVGFQGSTGVPLRRKRNSARAIGHAAATTNAPPIATRADRENTAPATPMGNTLSSSSATTTTASTISGGGAITPAMSRLSLMRASSRSARAVTASGCSSVERCPQSATLTSRAPGMPAAISSARCGGVSSSCAPTSTSVGQWIDGEQADASPRAP